MENRERESVMELQERMITCHNSLSRVRMGMVGLQHMLLPLTGGAAACVLAAGAAGACKERQQIPE